MSGYPGFRFDVTISIPTDSIPPSVINKATLRLTALKVGQDTRFNPPPQLIVTVVEDDGTTRSLADLLNNDGTSNTTGQSFVGGAAVVNGNYIQYEFNIPREIQKAVSAGKTKLKLRFAPSVTYPAAFRVVIDGPNSSNADTRMKLNIIYSKIK
ncbi:MAG: DUF4270 family protein [Sphingobacteriales bacterium]|nr:MAG: DUF4270 family protein [Sphingobacteriales bacterium]